MQQTKNMSIINLKKKLDKGSDIDMKNKSIINLDLPSNQRDAACVEFVNNRIDDMTQKKFLKVDGTNNMTGNLNLNNNKLINLQTDYRDSKSAVNVDFVKEEISDLRDLVTQKIRESQINNSGQKRDAFRYLMEDTDESSSETNIEVLGIVDFSNSPHQINKKAYQLKLLFEKGSPNQYQSRLGFNLYKLPVGYYTMVVEWFPPEMNMISVTAQGTTISIADETTKTFEKYTKTVIHFHRWGSSPPQFIYLDLHGTVSKQSFLTIGHLIVYGVKETISNVDPSVYDTAFVIENGKMVMQTDLSLNGHNLIGPVHYIHVSLNTTNSRRFLLNGCEEIIMNQNDKLLKIKLMYEKNKRQYTPISLKLNLEFKNPGFIGIVAHSIEIFNSTETTKNQTIIINHVLKHCCSLFIELNSDSNNEKIIMLLEYITQ